MSQVDWGATSAIIAVLVFIFGGSIALVAWTVKSRLEMMQAIHEAKLASLRSEFGLAVREIAEGARFSQDLYTTKLTLEQHMSQIEQTSEESLSDMRDLLATLTARLDAVGIPLNPEAWGAFSQVVAGAIHVLATNVEWHSATIERLADTDMTDPELAQKLRAAQVKLHRRTAPRLTELDLVSPSHRARASAARALADGVGDLESADRLLSLSAIDPTFHHARERLLKRLDESTPSVRH